MPRRSFLTAGLACLGALLLFWPTLVKLVRQWWHDPEYSHGLLVPLVSLVVLAIHRQDFLRQTRSPPKRATLAFAGLAAALAVFFTGRVLGINFIERLGLWGALVGGVAVWAGPAAVRARPFPFFFLLLAIPLPFFVLTPVRLALQELAAALAGEVLVRCGIPAVTEGNVLVLASQRLEVAEACSGIRSLMAFTTTSVVLAYALRAGLVRGTIVALSAVPVTVGINVLRVTVTAAVLAGPGIDLTAGAAHTAIGVAAFAAGVAVLYGTWRFVAWVFPNPIPGVVR